MTRSSSSKLASRFLKNHKKWPRYPFKTKLQEIFNQKQAMRDLRESLAEAEGSTTNPCRKDETHVLSSLVRSFRIHGCNPTPQAYSFVIKTLAKETSQLPQIATVLDHLERVESFETPEYIIVDVIKAYGGSGWIQEAFDVFCRIPKLRCVPSAYSLNALLSVLCRSRRDLEMVDAVLLNAQKMRIRLEESTFTVLINGLCRIDRVGYAIEMLHGMFDDGFDANPRTCSLILSLICKQKDSLSSSFDVVGFLEGLRKNGFCPSVRDYANVMKFLVDRGRGSDTLGVLNQMKSDRIKPDIVCYTIALKGVIDEDDYSTAEKLFDELLVLGLVPDVYTYSVYMDGLCKQNDVEGAIQLISSMEDLGCKANVITYNILLSAFVKAGQVGRARMLWKEMELKGICPNLQTYEIIIQGFVDNDETLEACGLLEEALNKCFCVRSLRIDEVIFSLCRGGSIDRVTELITKMADKGVSPSLRVWKILLLNCRFKVNVNATALICVLNS